MTYAIFWMVDAIDHLVYCLVARPVWWARIQILKYITDRIFCQFIQAVYNPFFQVDSNSRYLPHSYYVYLLPYLCSYKLSFHCDISNI